MLTHLLLKMPHRLTNLGYYNKISFVDDDAHPTLGAGARLVIKVITRVIIYSSHGLLLLSSRSSYALTKLPELTVDCYEQ